MILSQQQVWHGQDDEPEHTVTSNVENEISVQNQLYENLSHG